MFKPHGGDDARRVKDILGGKRQPVQGAVRHPLRRVGVRLLRLCQCIRLKLDDGVDLRIDGGDALEAGGDGFFRAHGAAAQESKQGGGRQPVEIVHKYSLLHHKF